MKNQSLGIIIMIFAFIIMLSGPIGALIGAYSMEGVLASLMGGMFVLLGATRLLEMDKKSPEENNASENKSSEKPIAPSTESKYQKYIYISYPNCKKYQDIDPNGDHWTWDKDEEGIFVVSDWLEKLKNL